LIQQLSDLLKALFQWWVVVTPWQQAVRVRFGKNTALLGPGLHLNLPIIDQVYLQPTRVRAQHIFPQTVTTRDGKAVSLSCSLQFSIADLLTVYEKVHNAHDLIEQKIQSIVSQTVYSKRLDNLTPGDVESEVLAEADLKEFGIEIHGFSITSFAVVRTFRLINGDMGAFTGYDQRFDTDLLAGEKK
jgi:regulator of protease activity HflC (stomatin/prohibitin superfamily)